MHKAGKRGLAEYGNSLDSYDWKNVLYFSWGLIIALDAAQKVLAKTPFETWYSAGQASYLLWLVFVGLGGVLMLMARDVRRSAPTQMAFKLDA